ncbi:MAG TPA: PfkB family carbohydrate kinase [Cellulomonas sp.]
MNGPLLVCCGLATLDVVQRVDRVPAPDEKVVARGLDVTFGGPAANAAATSVALGVPAVLVTALGSGPIARLVREGLMAAGVRVVDLAVQVPGDPPVSTVLVTAGTGQRAVVSTNATLRPDDLAPAAEGVAADVLGEATALLVDGHHLGAAVALASVARRHGIRVLADGGSWKPGLDRLLAHVDVAILSADFLMPAGEPGEPCAGGDVPSPSLVAPVPGADVPGKGRGVRLAGVDAPRASGSAPLAGVDVLDAVAALGPAFVARSDGAGPVRVRLPSGAFDEVTPLVVPPAEVVDTLGAGDVLHGAAGAAIARGLDPMAALREGVAAATESVRHPGALGRLDRS